MVLFSPEPNLLHSVTRSDKQRILRVPFDSQFNHIVIRGSEWFRIKEFFSENHRYRYTPIISQNETDAK